MSVARRWAGAGRCDAIKLMENERARVLMGRVYLSFSRYDGAGEYGKESVSR